MSRRKIPIKRSPKPDSIYRSRLVNMMVNRILKNGKKSLASRILYNAMKEIKHKTKKNPSLILRQAVVRATPKITIKARRIGGSNYQVPVEIKPEKGHSLAIRWLLTASRKRTGKNMVFKLANELLDAAKDTGGAIRKKEETHRMAEANRAFAHFRY